jgi:hypothetical protein
MTLSVRPRQEGAMTLAVSFPIISMLLFMAMELLPCGLNVRIVHNFKEINIVKEDVYSREYCYTWNISN